MRHGIADRQTMTAFVPTAGQNLAAILGFHARAKTVLVDALPVSRLICSLHESNLVGERDENLHP